jgi:hypothetical protein
MKRASPILHDVSSHNKVTPKTHRHIKVRKYQRGEGEPDEPTPQLFVKKGNQPTDREFKFTLKYDDDTSEKGAVQSEGYKTALPLAINHADRQVKSVTLSLIGGEI